MIQCVVLCEISQMPYEERQKYSDWALVHTFLKAESEKNLPGMLKTILKILFLSENENEVLSKILYCLFRSPQLDNKIIFDEVEKISDTNINIGEKIMSAATELRAEGRVEGRVEGQVEGQVEVLVETIQELQGILKCPVDITQELTGKSLEELRVQKSLLEDEIAKKLSF